MRDAGGRPPRRRRRVFAHARDELFRAASREPDRRRSAALPGAASPGTTTTRRGASWATIEPAAEARNRSRSRWRPTASCAARASATCTFPSQDRAQRSPSTGSRVTAADCGCRSPTRPAARRPTAAAAICTTRSRAPTSASRERDIVLDFNYAYNPSCAYDARWSCPLSPPENRLPFAVRASAGADAGPITRAVLVRRTRPKNGYCGSL